MRTPTAILVGLVALAPVPLRAEGAGRIVVDVEGLRSANGGLLCALYDLPAAFPVHADRARARTTVPLSTGRRCVFERVPAGTYAVAVVHDENGNGKLDTNFLGIPSEGVGASRDARGHFGPPTFADAAFVHPGGETVLTIHVRY